MSILLPLALAAAIQSKTSDKLPPANPLPPPATEEGRTMAPVSALLAGIAARDAAAISATLRDDATTTVVSQAADGTAKVTRLNKTQLLARFAPGAERFEERLADPAVDIDGDIAMVWSPYVFLIDGKVHHCGTDHFDLVRENGSWKIANLTFTSRTTGCEQ